MALREPILPFEPEAFVVNFKLGQNGGSTHRGNPCDPTCFHLHDEDPQKETRNFWTKSLTKANRACSHHIRCSVAEAVAVLRQRLAALPAKAAAETHNIKAYVSTNIGVLDSLYS